MKKAGSFASERRRFLPVDNDSFVGAGISSLRGHLSVFFKRISMFSLGDLTDESKDPSASAPRWILIARKTLEFMFHI